MGHINIDCEIQKKKSNNELGFTYFGLKMKVTLSLPDDVKIFLGKQHL